MAFAEFIHKPLKADRMRFDNRPWMDALYLDQSDKIVIMKSTKTGVSEWALCDLFCFAQQGLSGMYVLPDREVRNRFITTRFDIMTTRIPEYWANLKKTKKDVDAKGLKTIYGQTWAFVGSGGKSTFHEFNADVMYYDEHDLCTLNALTYGEDRTLGAAREIWRKIGNPTVSGYGIAEEFEASDKKHWFIKCNHCNEWQQLDWFINFVRQEDAQKYSLRGDGSTSGAGGDSNPLCRKCEGTLNRLAHGSWVAEHPSRDISGWNVSRLFGFPGNDDPDHIRPVINETFATFMKAQGNPTSMQRFYNNILSQTYAGAGAKFSDDILNSCVADYIMPLSAKGTYGGVDVGSRLHLQIEKVVKGKRRKLFIGTVPDWHELGLMVKRFGMTGGVVDAEPEHHMALDWVKDHPGWFVCYYNLPDTHDQEIDIDYVNQVIRVKRTASLDESMQSYFDQNVELPRDYRNVDDGDFVRMMCASTRVQETNNAGKVKFVWTRANDHHQHTDNYVRIAHDVCQGSRFLTVV